jgi:hypothetical protein
MIEDFDKRPDTLYYRRQMRGCASSSGQNYAGSLNPDERAWAASIRWNQAQAPDVPSEVPAPVAPPTPSEAATAFLRSTLIDAMPALEVQRLARAAGVKERTLRRASKKIGVRTFKRSGCWWWELPDEDGQPDDGPPATGTSATRTR